MSPDARPDDTAVVDQIEEVWTRISELGASLTDEQWKLPTALPGWSVQDNLTHLTDIELMIQGRPRPDHVLPDGLEHVKNEPGSRNEVFVDARRAWSGTSALNEFNEVTRTRIAQLRDYTTADFDAESWTPMGPGTVRDLLPFRMFDSWVHEQDMREALARPGGLRGLAAVASMARITATAGYVVAKKVGAPDSSTVVFELTEPMAETFAVAVDGGRAKPVDPVPLDATVRITTDGATYARLACGRADPAAALASGSVRVSGDGALGKRIVEELNFLF